MEKILNDAIIPILSDGNVSVSKMKCLIHLKEFIDRISSAEYIRPDAVDSIEKRFGTTPDVITWGDYFQTELAITAITLSDEDFEKTVDTIRFDIMAAWDIFSSNTDEFKLWVDEISQKLWILGKEDFHHSEEEKEIVHLKILLDYYNDLQINGNFYESELIWYHNFFEETATGTENITAH